MIIREYIFKDKADKELFELLKQICLFHYEEHCYDCDYVDIKNCIVLKLMESIGKKEKINDKNTTT